MLRLEDKIRLRDGIDYTAKEYLNGSHILIFPEIVQWLKTSSVGQFVFEELKDTELKVSALLEMVAVRYGIATEDIQRPIQALLSEFQRMGLLRINSDVTAQPPVIDIESEGLQQLWLNITDSCNFTCPYCYVPGLASKAMHMDTDLLLRLVDEAHALGVVELVFAGGEPTLHPDHLRVLAHARKKGNLHIKLVTNGSRDSVSYLAELCPLIDDLQVSVDGTNAETHDKLRGEGSFQKLSKVFAYVWEQHPELNCGISFTPTPATCSEIPKLYQLALSLRAKYVHVTRPKNPGTSFVDKDLITAEFVGSDFFTRIISAFDELSSNAYKDKMVNVGFDNRLDVKIQRSLDPGSELYGGVRKLRCAAGVLTMCVRPDGNCYPCAALCAEEHSLETVLGRPLAEAYRGLRSQVVKQFSVDDDPKCQQCEFRYFCGGGCRAIGESAAGRDAHCAVLKARYEQWIGNLGIPQRTDSDKPTPVNTQNEDGKISARLKLDC